MFSSQAKFWTAGAAAFALIAVFVLIMAQQSRQTYTVTTVATSDAAGVTNEWPREQAEIVPADPMSHNVVWAPSTGEN